MCSNELARAPLPPESVPDSLSTGGSLVPASHFTIQALTDAYNRARVDYLVPMPMSVGRLEAYIHNYDIVLDASRVVVADGEIIGLALMGVRGQSVWVTRMGVLPTRRRRGAGRALMLGLLSEAARRGAQEMWLEVIHGNTPAHQLFRSLSFVETRDLLILRRPPGAPDSAPDDYATLLTHQDAVRLLDSRSDQPSWLLQTRSLLNAGSLAALRVERPGLAGWLAFRADPFQLTHLVLKAEEGTPEQVGLALLGALHHHYPALDTVVDNLPADDSFIPAYTQLGYVVSFRRIEMRRPLELSVTPGNGLGDSQP
jgi:ribosomal protein S18 acetylase RimI-like enzyme